MQRENDMENGIAVSVICSTYNHEKYIRDALEGFVMQKTTFPFEVLVHDDASTDGTADIIREYERKYPDIIKPIYQTENQYSKKVGITAVYQISRARGKYIAPCEGDDYWTDPMKLQKQYDFMERNPEYTLCACSTLWLDMLHNKVEPDSCRTDRDRDVSLEELILEQNGRAFQYATIFARKELFLDRPEWMKNFGVGDTPLMLRAAQTGRVRMLADTMAVYRAQTNGSWSIQYKKNAEFRIKVFERLIRGFSMFNEETEYRYDAVISRRLRTIRYRLARDRRDLKALVSREYREVFASRPLKLKISDIVYCLSPRLQQRLKKLR